jgi:hypothetical protein
VTGLIFCGTRITSIRVKDSRFGRIYYAERRDGSKFEEELGICIQR